MYKECKVTCGNSDPSPKLAFAANAAMFAFIHGLIFSVLSCTLCSSSSLANASLGTMGSYVR